MIALKPSVTLVPLSMLRHGHDPAAPAGVVNVRVVGRDAGLDELAASVSALGLLQPLVVVPGDGGLHYVVDGNRRLAALNRLAEVGAIPADTDIDVMPRDAATAREAGLAANINQRQMHEADQVRAFAELAAGGMKLKGIATRFGCSIAHVKRLLALGGVAPVVLDAWREDKHGVTIETVKSFTLGSIEAQEETFAKLSKGNGRVMAYQVREALGADQSNGRLLRCVGLDAYKAAGGNVVTDLFGDSHAVTDAALLKRLADERLAARRDELRADGWAWAEIDSDLPEGARYSWRIITSTQREPIESEATRLREIEDLLGAEEGTVPEAELDGLAIEANRIEESLVTRPGPADKSRSGCIVSWDYQGEIDVRMFVLRPEAKGKAAPVVEGDAPAEPEGGTLSAAMVERLSAQLTEAVQDSLGSNPHAALAAMLAGATCKDKWHAPFRVRLDGVGGEHASVRDNERFETLFERFLAMGSAELMAATAQVLVRAVDVRSFSHAKMAAPANRPGVSLLAGALDADMLAERLAERWDARSFFSGAPRAVTEAAIAEACGADAAARARKLKKAELTEVALATVVPTGWIPREIRWPGYRGPGAAQAEPAPVAEAA